MAQAMAEMALPEGASPKHDYIDALRLIERLHRRFLDIIKFELDKLGFEDINSVQVMLLYNIGDAELTAGELKSRGYYLGSNVSYNLKSMVEAGYIEQERALHDKRAVKIKLSAKGSELCAQFDKALDDQSQGLIDDHYLGRSGINTVIRSLRQMERFWSDKLQFL